MASDSNDDWAFILVFEICPDLGGGLYAVHDGHTKVCEDDAVPHSILVGLFNLPQSFFPMDAEFHLKVRIDAQ